MTGSNRVRHDRKRGIDLILHLGKLPVAGGTGRHTMRPPRILHCVATLLFVGCTGVAPIPPAATQQAQEVGDACSVQDGTDTCNPDETGLCCCTRGPTTEGFCIDTCPSPCV